MVRYAACDSIQAKSDSTFTNLTPLEACLWLLMDRDFTGGLKSLALVGRMAALSAERQSPLIGHRSEALGSLIHSGLKEIGAGDCTFVLCDGSLIGGHA